MARLICSDGDCPEEFEARAGTLAALEALSCECGCALEVLGWPDEDQVSGSEADLDLTPLRAARVLVLS